MSQVLTVPTHFNDIGELSDGFLDRVESDTLILYGPVAYEEDSEIEFSVLLADGTPALEGTGRVRAAVDGGVDRVPETRYDVVLEALCLDGRSEVVFERLVIDRQPMSEPPPALEEAQDGREVEAVAEVADEEEAPTMDAAEATVAAAGANEEAFEMTVESLSPDVYDEDFGDDDSPTVLQEVDQETLDAVLAPTSEVDAETGELEPDDEEELVHDESDSAAAASAFGAANDAESRSVSEETHDSGEAIVAEAMEAPDVVGDEPELAFETPVEHEGQIAAVLANANATEIAIDSEAASKSDSESTGHVDSMYAFEHGISAEPQVGMPVPVPSMAAPPQAPPAPPRLRLAEPPEGLTRPSLAGPDEMVSQADDEVSDVHQTGMFAYEGGLPIPERPPLPDPNRAKQVPPVEAANDYDVQESEPAELISEGFEEVRLSDFAEAVEEG